MDAKITKKRLEHLLSYDWIKILLAAFAAVMVWMLVFTMTATRITTTERFVVNNYYGVHYGTRVKIYDSYSYGVIEAEIVDNMRAGEGTFRDLFSSNLELSDGDVLMVADAPRGRSAKKDEQGNELKDAEGNVIYEYDESYLHAMLRAYGSRYFTRLDDSEKGKGYFTQMQEYLAKFYPVKSEAVKVFGGVSLTKATFDKDSLDEEAVEAAFRARVANNKDKRFKKESQIVEGIEMDKARIRSYLEAYENIFSYLEKGYVELTTVSLEINEQYTLTGAYGINLCPSASATMKNLKEHIYYENLDGAITADNLNALFMTFDDLDKDFQYENLLYLNALIQDVCTEL
ncbi:MAG: hypothetical protein IJF39_04860 [Clostridia bacterium]|nr:hypothetical protein [Clostridia bacterium]